MWREVLVRAIEHCLMALLYVDSAPPVGVSCERLKHESCKL